MSPLLAYLLIFRAEAIPRRRLAANLWPDAPDSDSRANLRRHLHHLNRALPPGASPWFVYENGSIALNPAVVVELDLDTFERAGETLPDLASAVSLYDSDLLLAMDEEWLAPERERLRQRYVRYLERLATLRRLDGDLGGSLQTLRTLLEADPYREDALRQIMTLRANRGDAAGALDEYRRFAGELRADFGADPAAQTVDLRDRIAGGQVAGDPVALPSPTTTFIGRGPERERIVELAKTSRIITLVGPPGVGKTRLVIETARSLAGRMNDAIAFVDLAPVSDALDVRRTIEAAVVRACGLDVTVPIERQLGSRRVLAIVDNCEHLRAACAAEIRRLLRASNALAIIATSREPLGIDGEALVRVEPIPLPEAEQLFVDRVRLARAGQPLPKMPPLSIRSMCERLGRLPLALELAAARARSLTIEQLDRFVHEHLDVLTEAFERSYDELDDDGQSIFRRAGVFHGGFDLDAARAIVLPESDRWAMLDALSSLCDKSLLVPPAIDAPEQRFTMLMPAREFAQAAIARLGESDTIRERYIAHYVALAESMNRKWGKLPADLWLRRMWAERGNFEAALDLAFASDERRPSGLALVGALRIYWYLQMPAVGLEWARRALAFAGGADPSIVARLHLTELSLLDATGRPQAARAAAARAIELYEGLGDDHGLALALRDLGGVLCKSGERERGENAIAKALALFERCGDEPRVSGCLQQLAISKLGEGELEDARTLLLRTLDIARTHHDVRTEAAALINLAEVAFRGDDAAAAFRWIEDAIPLMRQSGDELHYGVALYNYAAYAIAAGRYGEAAGRLRDALQSFRNTGGAVYIALTIQHFASIAIAAGDGARAARLLGYCDARLARLGVANREYTEERERALLLDRLSADFGETALLRLFEEGAVLSEDGAIAAALEA